MSYLISIFVIIIGWAFLTSSGDGMTANLEDAGLNTALAEKLGEPMIITSCFAASLAAVIGYTWIYQKNKMLFWCLAIMAFCLSEPAIPLIHEASLGIRYLFLATIVGILISNISGDIKNNKLLIPLAVFGTIIIASTVANFEQGASATSLGGLLIIGIFVPLILPSQLNDCKKDVENAFLYAFSILGVIFSTALVANPHAFVAGRFCSWFVLPTNFGNLCSIMCVFFLWYATNKSLSSSKRLLALANLALCLGMLVMSGTRNGMFSFIIAVFLISVLIDKKIGLKLLMIVALIGLILAPSMNMRERVKNATERFFMVRDKESRDEVWNMAIDLVGKADILGYGINITAGSDPKRTINPHNTILGNYLRFGIFGAVSLIVIYLIVAFQALNYRARGNKGDQLKILAQVMAIILFISGMFEDNYSGGVGAYQFLIALFISLTQTGTSATPLEKHSDKPKAMLSVA